MVSGQGDPDDEGEVLPELCDLCGTVIRDGGEWDALVPDSSVIHEVDPQFDGKRWLSACSREHLAELVEQYKHRPFVEAELWAGKIGRAIEQHRGEISEEDLARETGLTPEQIEAGVMWQNVEFLRFKRQQGGDGSDPSGPGGGSSG
ncbi:MULTISPECIES: hypothetical protein [unclassified Streptomyces]|uniref:hypothetical protein n=1 Tax=unclassified Streptomyces TaxID=2593676 RepID=UPI00380AC03F